jgi:hypothetical protein
MNVFLIKIPDGTTLYRVLLLHALSPLLHHITEWTLVATLFKQSDRGFESHSITFYIFSCDSGSGVAQSIQWLDYGLYDRGSIAGTGKGNFLHHRVQTGSEAHAFSYPVGTGGSSARLKQSERKAVQSSPPSADVKKEWSYTSTPPYAFMAWCLVKFKDKFTSYLWRYMV